MQLAIISERMSQIPKLSFILDSRLYQIHIFPFIEKDILSYFLSICKYHNPIICIFDFRSFFPCSFFYFHTPILKEKINSSSIFPKWHKQSTISNMHQIYAFYCFPSFFKSTFTIFNTSRTKFWNNSKILPNLFIKTILCKFFTKN